MYLYNGTHADIQPGITGCLATFQTKLCAQKVLCHGFSSHIIKPVPSEKSDNNPDIKYIIIASSITSALFVATIVMIGVWLYRRSGVYKRILP
jgi:hypothetical protein